MSDQFNPYFEWLGIEPHEMPADHYRLLGIRRFESDPAVIAAAADQRMLKVRTFQTGPRAAHTQRMLNELAAAKVCLLNPGAKAGYDQVLVAFEAPAESPPAALPAPIAAPVVSPDQFYVPDEDDFDEELDGESNTIWILAGTLLTVVLVGICAIIFVQSRNNDELSEADTRVVSPLGNSQTTEPPQDDREPVLLYQESDGSINLDASFAKLEGPSLTLGISGTVNVITDWESMDDQATWKFKVAKLPPQGIFQVRVTYAARPEADGGSFVISVGDHEKECEIRGEGNAVTDEYYIAVPKTGDHLLTVRAKSKPAERLMTLKSVNLSFK